MNRREYFGACGCVVITLLAAFLVFALLSRYPNTFGVLP